MGKIDEEIQKGVDLILSHIEMRGNSSRLDMIGRHGTTCPNERISLADELSGCFILNLMYIVYKARKIAKKNHGLYAVKLGISPGFLEHLHEHYIIVLPLPSPHCLVPNRHSYESLALLRL